MNNCIKSYLIFGDIRCEKNHITRCIYKRNRPIIFTSNSWSYRGCIVGPTSPILEPTIVSSYSEYVQIFGELIESGSDKYQYLTSHTAQEYLRQGGPQL